jgi:hypothetical protein
MIGVIADSAEHGVIREFFELFKTPWEFYRSDRQYEVLLCSGDGGLDESTAKLVLIYASRDVAFDAVEKIEIAARTSNRILSYNGVRIPIYGESITFRGNQRDILMDEELQYAGIHQHQSSGRVVARIGYDLFSEIRVLLTSGQPAVYADIPTLDLHIALLRDLIIANEVPLVEVPPVPDGYRFITCLTHDVDHPSIRCHKWDHTIVGFLYRAVLEALVNLFRSRITARDLFANWAAALKLPFVYMGLAKDFWDGFDDRYLELEKECCSTFFVIPFKDNPGKDHHGSAPAFRAARYGAQDIVETIGKLAAAGCEIGLHGIDAWLNSIDGQRELEEIGRVTGAGEIGVRMHWLYYDQKSAVALEHAGAAYDSTVGYKETVGYRSGTTQAYKPLDVDRLLELPMHVMDTALFYPVYMGLSQPQATEILERLVDNVSHLGGCITVNWHDRSLSPERLWYACYRDLVEDLKNRGTWFATAGQATSWFKKRRSVVFETDGAGPNTVHAKVMDLYGDTVPGLRLRTYNPRGSYEEYVDTAFNESIDNRTLAGVGR